MSNEKSQSPSDNSHISVETDPTLEEGFPKASCHSPVSPRMAGMMVLLLLIGILAIILVFWRQRFEKVAGASPAPILSGDQADNGDGESTKEVNYVTKGEWIETTGLWSKFGVLGAVFDGEKIVMSSADSSVGSLGCWISPRKHPMTGICYEIDRASNSKLTEDRSCAWKIVALEISPSSILGTRSINTEVSDPACGSNKEPRPYIFILDVPHRSASHWEQ